MYKNILWTIFSFILSIQLVYAQETMDLKDFEVDDNILPITDMFPKTTKRKPHQKSIIPFITSSIAEPAVYNLSNAEQVFCYTVQKRPTNYTGYTLDSFAIEGYCGELNPDKVTTVYEALFTKSPNIITTPANCTISPKVMLRFVRGVDYTDVLLSSPCPSFTVFYAGKYKAFNIKQAIIDDIIKQFNQTIEPFNSPALIEQTMANAKATTPQQAEQLEKKQREQQPLISWQTPQKTEDNAQTAPSTKSPQTGWGKLKLKMK